ncbi:MAG: arginyltransferase [Gemmatimonadetes bacterium]|nr:MAG: arginyltransferase [Gemmatimonadota bacterium]
MKSIPPIQPTLSVPRTCGYFSDRQWVFEEFGYEFVRPQVLDELLAAGWRHFGIHFFRPRCPACQACQPIRIPVKTFSPSRSQRRALRKNTDVTLEIVPPEPRLDTFHLYARHNQQRFKTNASPEFYLWGLTDNVCQTKEFRYKLNGRLIAAGFIDEGITSLSSMYFVYEPRYAKRSLGVFSILKEIEYAQKTGREYYYLGYYIEGNSHMSYKNAFKPNEIYDWETQSWWEFLE